MYDALGRISGLSINGTANTTSTTFDDLGRVTSVANPLATGTGLFQYTYVPDTARVSAINYPNGQQTNFSYYGNTGDDRLQEISNLGPSSTVLSQFNYGYDAEGEITSWQQSSPALSGTQSFALAYDLAGQLVGAALTSGTSVTSNIFGYDKAGNRTQEQVNSATTTFTYNNLNQLTGQSAGGLTQFQGNLSEWANVTVGGSAATLISTVTGSGTSYSFDGAANLTTGTNTVAIVATDASGNVATNNYQVVVPSGTGATLTYDADGEMTSNGAGQTYQWDAAGRLAEIIYTGTGNQTQFTYNGLNQRVKIVETSSGTVTSTKQFVWNPGDPQPSEERDASNNVTRRLFPQGEQISGTNYYYTKDHLGSIRELTNSAGAVQTRYSYDMWGVQTTLSGTLNSEFGYAGYYQHPPSALDLTLGRPYTPSLARWLSRDPLGEKGGINLYTYVLNDPVFWSDLLGLKPGDPYASQLAAAEAALNDAYNDTMGNPNSEYGGNIYQMPNGQYSYTPPISGDENSGTFTVPKKCPGKKTSDYHSHPYGGLSEPSPGDISAAQQSGLTLYNVGPDGRMWSANPNGSISYLGNLNPEK